MSSMDDDGTGIMFRFWTTDGKRRALWRVWYDGRFEYHVSSPRTTVVEDFYADRALARAGAKQPESYRLLSDYYSKPENAVPVMEGVYVE